MNVNLPYEIGTVLKTMESGKVQYDKVHHYCRKQNSGYIGTVLRNRSSISTPIDIEELQQRWEVFKTYGKN